MDTRVMELRIKQWIPLIEEQSKSGISKDQWCTMHGINRTSFFGGRNGSGNIFLITMMFHVKIRLHSFLYPVNQVLLKSLPHSCPLWK